MFKLPDLTAAMGKLEEFIKGADAKIDAQTTAIKQLGRAVEMLWQRQDEIRQKLETFDGYAREAGFGCAYTPPSPYAGSVHPEPAGLAGASVDGGNDAASDDGGAREAA